MTKQMDFFFKDTLVLFRIFFLRRRQDFTFRHLQFLALLPIFLCIVGGKRANVSPNGKQLLRPMDTRDLRSALPDFWGWRKG